MFRKILFFFVLVSIIIFYCLKNPIVQDKNTSNKPIVAITQIAPHPSLDAIRQGILDELAHQHTSVEIIYENAQGNITLAAQIANKFVSLNPKVIVSITTPSTQAVYNVAQKYHIPVVYSAVSDPVAAKLVDSATKVGAGIAGVCDFSPIQQQIDLILAIQPNLKKLGVLYNAAEANSVALIEKLDILIKAHDIELVKVAAANTQEVSSAAASLIGKVDALYIPNDNTIVSSLESVIKMIDQKMPIYAADPQSVIRGCLASAAYGQYEIGRETGKVLVKVLEGVAPETIPMQTLTKVEFTLNQEVADKLGLTFPSSLLHQNPTIVGKK
jgi:putative ABC transport system substrate-binding protein